MSDPAQLERRRRRNLEALVEHLLLEWHGRGWGRAFHALVELGPAILPLLDERLAEERDGGLRAELLAIAQALRVPGALPLFARGLADADERVWKAALDGLVALADPQALEILEAARESPAPGAEAAEWRAWLDEAASQLREALPAGDTRPA